MTLQAVVSLDLDLVITALKRVTLDPVSQVVRKTSMAYKFMVMHKMKV